MAVLSLLVPLMNLPQEPTGAECSGRKNSYYYGPHISDLVRSVAYGGASSFPMSAKICQLQMIQRKMQASLSIPTFVQSLLGVRAMRVRAMMRIHAPVHSCVHFMRTHGLV